MAEVNKFATEKNKFLPQDGMPYVDCRMFTTYVFDEGKVALDVGPGKGGEDLECKIVKLKSRAVEKWVSFTAQRAGGPPDVPSAETSDPNEVLMKRFLSPVAPVLLPNGIGLVWQITGTYVYRLKKAFDPEKDGLTVGSLPTVDTAETDFPAESFTGGLLE
jgi:hypothetical protein